MNDLHRRPSLAIIGGGLAGIAAALELAQAGQFKITILEKDGRLGGLASSYKWHDMLCDRFYHVILPADKLALDLIERLELESRLKWRKSKSGFYGKGRLVPFSSAMDFARFPFLSWGQKFRLGLGIYRVARVENPEALDSLTVPQWLTQVFGSRVYESFWEPLVRAKLGDSLVRTSADFIWATIRRLYGARGSAGSVEKLGALTGGISTLLPAAEKSLAELGVEVHAGAPVDGLAREQNKIVVRTRGSSLSFDKAVLTVPSPEISKMIPDENSSEAWRRILQTEYLGVICALLILKRPLSSYYTINLLDKSLPFTGIIESTNVLSPETIGGRHLVYLPKYLTQDDPLLKVPEDRALDIFVGGLRKVFPSLKDEEILHSRLFRAPYVQPIRQPGSGRERAGFETPMPGVYVANSSLIKNSTLNIDAALKIARDVVQVIAAPDSP